MWDLTDKPICMGGLTLLQTVHPILFVTGKKICFSKVNYAIHALYYNIRFFRPSVNCSTHTQSAAVYYSNSAIIRVICTRNDNDLIMTILRDVIML